MYEFLEYRVADAMTREVVTIGPETTLRRAQELFEKHDFDALPVLGDGGRLVGMLAKLDLCKAFAFTPTSKIPRYHEILERPAEEVMRRDPISVEPGSRLTRALATMIETGFKSLPVVEEQRLVGIVAREDVLSAIRRATQGRSPE